MDLEILDLRRVNSNQLTPLFELESRVWNEGLRWDFGYAVHQISVALRERRLWGYALVAQAQPKGYSIYFYDGPKALIGNLFIDPACADSSQVRRLVERVTETLFLNPSLRRIEAQLPHFTFEELEPLFRDRCFEGYRRRFMAASLVNRQQSTWGARAGDEDFFLAPWEPKYDSEAAELLYGVYQHHIDTIINDLYASLAGTRRLIENIVQHRGCGNYLPQGSRVAVHRSTQKLAGILAVTEVRPGTAHIPQIAVAKQFQAAGLGSAMLESSFRFLTEQSYREISLTATDLNAGAVRLYERLGFKTFRSFGAFVWKRPG